MISQDSPKSFRIDHLPPYLLGEIAESVLKARLAGRDVVDMSQVNPDTGPPPASVERLVQNILNPIHHRYSSSQGIKRLREAFCEKYAAKYAVDCDCESEVVVCMGVKEGLSHLLLAALSPGDNVLVPTPSYPIHTSSVFIAGGGFIGVPLAAPEEMYDALPCFLNSESRSFFERLDYIFERTWPRPKAMVLSFPHNPTTSTVSLDFFERLVDFARRNEIFLVHDFAYSDICFDDYQAPSLLQVKGASEVAVEFYSLSKSHGLAGWRVGFCIGNAALVQALKKIKSYLDFGIFQPLQIAAIEALLDKENKVAATTSLYESRRDVLVDGLKEIGWNVERPRGTVFVWSQLPESCQEMGSRAFAQKLLEEGGVAVCPGAAFDAQADAFVRFALVEPEARIRKALKSIKNVIS